LDADLLLLAASLLGRGRDRYFIGGYHRHHDDVPPCQQDGRVSHAPIYRLGLFRHGLEFGGLVAE